MSPEHTVPYLFPLFTLSDVQISSHYQVIFWVAGVLFVVAQTMLLASVLHIHRHHHGTGGGHMAALRHRTLSLLPAGNATTVPPVYTCRPLFSWSCLRDYLSLTKPRVLSLLLLTTLVAMVIAGEGMPSFGLVFWTMLGGYLAAGGAGAINCALDCDIDRMMGRTSKRPVPNGRIVQQHAFWFGVALSVLAFVVLSVFATLLAAVLAIGGVVYYALIYTHWLKRSTWHNVVIGGGAGTLPPLVGWAAITGSLSLPALILAAIIFYWTPVHFWTLALTKKDEYRRACLPMLPVVAGERETRRQIVLYTIATVALSLLLLPMLGLGMLYLLLALVLNMVFLLYAWKIWRGAGRTVIWHFYAYSLMYLGLLFVSMVLDRVWYVS
jgi:protoheme IX farnesyltransferase